jgi:hypothetical protein
MKKRSIDALLRQWADEQEPHKEQMDALRSRIAGKATMIIPASEAASRASAPPSASGRHIWRSLSSAVVGAVACLLVIVVINRIGGSGGASSSSEHSDPSVISHCRIATGVKLFEEMDRLFNGNLRWVAESNGEMGIGVEEEREQLDTPPALVRLTVMARSVGASEWREVWQSDVMVREQDLVEVSPGHSSDTVSLWVFPLEDGNISIDTTVAINTPIQIQASESTVATPGMPIQVASVTEQGTEYRVYQTVVLLEQGGGV